MRMLQAHNYHCKTLTNRSEDSVYLQLKETPTSKSQTEGSNSKSQTSEDASKHRDTGHLSQSKDFDLSSYLFKQQTVAEKSVSAKLPKPNTTASIGNTKTSNSKGSSSSKSSTTKCSSGEKKSSNDKAKKEFCKERVFRINSLMQDKNTKLYCFFLESVIPLFDHANQFLQREDPCIHLVHDVMVSQVTELLIRFLKPDTVTKANSISEIQFQKIENQKTDNELYIGSSARKYINEHRHEVDLNLFFKCVRKYYLSACEYITQKFPFKDKVLYHAKVLDISKRAEVSFQSLKFFLEKYPILYPKDSLSGNIIPIDKIEDEFLHYQVQTLSLDITQCVRIDEAWTLIEGIKNPVTANKKYKSLVSVMRGIMCVFHSNADCERIFSVVNKNKNEFRSSLGTKNLSNLMTHKVLVKSQGTECHNIKHTSEFLRKAKSATYNALRD